MKVGDISHAMARRIAANIAKAAGAGAAATVFKKDSTLIRLPKNKKAPRWSGTPKLTVSQRVQLLPQAARCQCRRQRPLLSCAVVAFRKAARPDAGAT
jgi:hypothetical protein